MGSEDSTNRRKSTRRQFLRGEAAVNALQHTIDEVDAVRIQAYDADTTDTRTYLTRVGRRAMACEFEFYLNAGQQEDSVEAAIEALDLVDQLEDQMTVYRDHSELARINRIAAERPVQVESQLYALLVEAVRLSAGTDGAFDITAGPLSKLWGFYRRQGELPELAHLNETLAFVGSRFLSLKDAERTVQFKKPGVEINLGAIGKGYALDRCAEFMRSQGAEDFLFHGGQSSILASGSRTGVDVRGWTIGIRHPRRPDWRLATLRLLDQAVGTSGTGTQYFHHKGRRYGHILDPRTGWPAEGVLSATALAPQAATADALATAFYVLGLEATQQYCDDHAEVGAVLTMAAESSRGVEVLQFNIRGDQLSLRDV